MVEERKKFLHPARNQTLDHPAQNPVIVLTTYCSSWSKPLGNQCGYRLHEVLSCACVNRDTSVCILSQFVKQIKLSWKHNMETTILFRKTIIYELQISSGCRLLSTNVSCLTHGYSDTCNENMSFYNICSWKQCCEISQKLTVKLRSEFTII